MNIYAYLILRTDGTVDLVRSKMADFTLSELRDGIKCDTIQIVPGRVTNMLLVIDDEGKLRNKPINILATKLYMPELDFIVGDVILGTRFNDDPFAEPDVYKLPLDIARRYQVILESMLQQA